MAAISLLGFSLPEGLILAKSVNGNMASSVLSNSKQEATNLSKTFSKITVQNVLSEHNGNSINISNNSSSGGNNSSNSAISVTSGNAIVRKIKDFGMVGAVNNAAANSTSSIQKSLIIRKRPLVESKNLSGEPNKPLTPVTKKLKSTKESTTPKMAKKSNNENVQRVKKTAMNTLANNGLQPRPAGTPGRKGLPLPQAVARRNARERNRVKQVNNGFAALRERIPEEVAEAFESQQGSTSGRGNTAKKLSKVETLRMAVEYIRSLERLLGFDFSLNAHVQQHHTGSGSSGEDSYTLIKDEFDTLSPCMDDNFDDSMSHYDMDDYFSTNSNLSQSNNNNNNNEYPQTELTPPMDLLPDITTLNGLQYIRIPGTNTYQLLTPDIFVGSTHSPPNSSLDDEQFNALIDANCMSPATTTTTTTTGGLTTSPINANISASPTTTQAINSATPASPNNAAVAQCGSLSVSTPTALSARLSPVPTQTSSSSSTSSPDAGSSSSLYQRQAPMAMATTTLTLSPASVVALLNERTAQACANASIEGFQRQFLAPTLPHLLPQFIKQEYVGDQVDFGIPTTSTSTTTTTSSPNHNNIFETTPAGDQHATLSLSPPLDGCNRLLMAPHHNSAIELNSFYEQDDSGSFYESSLSYKKELNDVLLDASTATNTGLSDESMIEAIDWWEAHTPQTEGGAVAGCGSVML